MSQRHLLALLEPLTSMLLQLQHHNELALYFTGGRFSPHTCQQLISTFCHLLWHIEYTQQQYASHSFRISAATTAAASGLPAWLNKMLGRRSSEAYQSYNYISISHDASISAITAS